MSLKSSRPHLHRHVGATFLRAWPRVLLALALGGGSAAWAHMGAAAAPAAIAYGANTAAGRVEQINGIGLYAESYGSGQPMLIIHGSGQSIAAVAAQVAYFAPNYAVLAADSRGHGKSGLGSGRLTYEQMAEDLNRLMALRGLRSVYVLGWSDGGIIGLLLAIHHPDKVAKLAVMGANLQPSGAYDWAQQFVAREARKADAMLAKGDTSKPWEAQKQQLNLLAKQPNIGLSELKQISVPVLVMAGDKDVIKAEHTLQIFDNLRYAHLAIFPGATHMIPIEDAALFNATVAKFFSSPYTRPDTRDLFK